MKRILVLGAAGFIGQALCKRLKAEGASLLEVDMRGPDGRNKLITDLRLHRYPSMETFDEVYQLAANVGGVAYLSGGHDADVMADNVAINRNVAQWAVGHCRVLVFTSSACVYPLATPNQRFLEPPWAEEDGGFREYVPANDYGWEKLFSERLYLAHARDHGLNVRIARLGNVYGPGEPLSGPRAHLVGDLCRKALLSDGPIEVWGDGMQTRSMVYVDDVVGGLIALARAANDPGPVNIAGPPVRVCEVANEIAGFCRRGVTFVHGPTGARSSALDTTKARESLGWAAKTPLRNGLRATFEWALTA